MTDVAALGLAIDSSDVVRATTALENFNAETAKSPTNVSRLTTASDALIAALSRNTAATDALSARMSAMESAATKAANSFTNVGQASERATSNVVQFNTAATKTRTELDATTAAVDKMTAAWSRLGTAGAEVSKNLTPQGIAEFRLSNMSGNGGVPMQPGASPVTGSGGETPRGLSDEYRRQILTNIAFQGKDFFEQAMVTGQYGRAALVQAPQVASLMQMGGLGVGDVVSAAGSGLKSVAEGAVNVVSKIGLLGAAAGTAVTAVLAMTVAQQNYAAFQTAITRALATGDGRRSGATAGDINAAAAGGNGDLSRGTRRDYATQLAGAGVNPALYGGILDTVKDYAATTGQDQAAALGSLAQAFADPSKGAEMLNKQLGFLDATQRENIQTLAAQGDKLGAARALQEAYGTSLVKASELTSGWSRATEAVLTPLASLWDKIGEKVDRVVTGGSLEDRIADARRAMEGAQAAAEGGLGFFSSKDVEKTTEAYNKLMAEQARNQQRSDRARQSDASLGLDNTLKALNPQNEAMKALEAQAIAIRRPFMENWIDPTRQAQAALQGLAAQTKQMREDMAAGGAQYADAIRNAQHNLGTVGFSTAGKAVSDINQSQDMKELEARRRASLDTSNDQYLDSTGLDRALASIKQERELLLKEREESAKIATSNTSGSYAIGLAQVPERYRSLVYNSATAVGNLNPDLLASVLNTETGGSFKPNLTSPAGAQGIAQFMPKTAAGMGLKDPFDPEQAIPAAARLLSQLLKQYGGDEASALVGYNATVKVRNRYQESGRDPSVLPDETRNYLTKTLTPSPSAKANLEEQAARTRALDEEKKGLEALVAAGGRDTAEYRARLEVIQQQTEAQAKNRTLSADMTKQLQAEAAARQDVLMGKQFQSYVANDNFARQQLGRSQDDQSAYSQARPYEGTQYYDQVLQRSRETSDMQQTKQMVMDGATSFVSALRRGASASEALSTAFGNAADKLLNKALDSIISGGFGLLQGSGSGGGGFGGLGSLFKMGGDSGLPNLNFGFPGFSSGGYTGPGGKYDPAGIVHAGEVVFSQADVARFGGAAVVERLRQGFPGYADGGIVGGGAAAGGPGGQTNIQVNMQGSSGDPQKDQAHVDNTVKALRDEMDTRFHQNLSRSLQTNGSLWKAGVRRAAG